MEKVFLWIFAVTGWVTIVSLIIITVTISCEKIKDLLFKDPVEEYKENLHGRLTTFSHYMSEVPISFHTINYIIRSVIGKDDYPKEKLRQYLKEVQKRHGYSLEQ